MKLPRYLAKTPPPRGAGLVRAQDIPELTAVGDAQFRALAQLGAAEQKAANLGFQAYMLNQNLTI